MSEVWPPRIGIAPYFEDETCVIYNGDCRVVLPQLDAGTVDHVFTDPPYSSHVHANTKTNAGTCGDSGGKELELGFDSLSEDMMAFVASEIRRLLRRWSLVFCDVESAHLWRAALCAVEGDTRPLEYIRTGIWLKGNPMPQITGDRPGSGYESLVIAHATDGGKVQQKRWNGGGRVGVWRADVPKRRRGRVHPSEKPFDLLTNLLLDFTNPSDVVLDMFAGSGSLARAAHEVLALRGDAPRVILVEADEQWCAQAASRRGAPVPVTSKGQGSLQW